MSDCIRFAGYHKPDGYGHRGFRGKQTGAHRVAWIEANGPIPAGMTVDHLCRLPT